MNPLKTCLIRQNWTTETATLQIVFHYLQSNTDPGSSAEFSLHWDAAFIFPLVTIHYLITAIIHLSSHLFPALALKMHGPNGSVLFKIRVTVSAPNILSSDRG
ncbi:MAG: hypothetical protein AMJ61_09120 [Desulfobacterales bacterium SG8_35_2]|nr:MAG: hypothetical protein AMJ61_09120 [Desulfobacterales bacterium SG8_35_2]